MRASAAALTLLCAAAVSAEELHRVRVHDAPALCAAERWLLGENWRALWREPVELPELDLEETAHGLSPVDQVGAYQTLGLALAGGDGRSYTFRSLAKRGHMLLPLPMRWGPVRALLVDQATANLPAADLVVARMSRQLDVLATPRRLVVMPDDPALGEYRKTFAALPGTISEYPTAGDDGEPGTFGARELVTSEELWQRTRAGETASVDARAYLRARLLDWWVADWDRHPSQWRWARLADEPGWQPVPEDHDHAFSDYDGWLVRWARPVAPWLGPFAGESSPAALNDNSRWLDTWLLAGLDRRAWDEEVARFRAHDAEAIAREALAGLPEPWRRAVGEEIRRVLAERWRELPDVARETYASLARVVHLHGSDGDDRVNVHCSPEGPVEVVLERAGDETVLRRTFLPGETARVTFHLHGGEDVVERTGAWPCAVVLTRETGPLRLARGVPAPVGERRPGKPGRRPRSEPL